MVTRDQEYARRLRRGVEMIEEHDGKLLDEDQHALEDDDTASRALAVTESAMRLSADWEHYPPSPRRAAGLGVALTLWTGLGMLAVRHSSLLGGVGDESAASVATIVLAVAAIALMVDHEFPSPSEVSR